VSRAAAVLITLVAYKALLLAIGLVARARTRDGLDFFLGGRRLGPTVAAISASASSSSAWTLLGVSGFAYLWGLSAVWIFPACVGGFLFNWYLLAPRLRTLSRRTGAVTVTEILAGPRGPWQRPIVWTASLIVLFSLTIYVAAQFQASGKTFAETFDLSPWSSILIGSGVVVAYTLLGGFWAVSLTDTLQGLVMALTALVLPVVALTAVGGPAALAEGLAGVGQAGYLSLTGGAAGATGLGFVLGLLGIGLGYPGQPHVVNRFMALRKGEGAMRRARRIAMGWALVVYAGMILLGLCGRLLHENLADGERVFISVANEHLPPLLSGVMIAAVLSAIMSTADSQLLVAASSVSHDLAPAGRGGAGPLLRSRLVVVGLSAAAIAAALLGSEEIFRPVLFAWTALGAAFGPLLVVTVLRGPVPGGRTLAAMLAGFVVAVLGHLFAEAVLGREARAFGGRVLPFVASLAVIFLPPGSVSSGTTPPEDT
jgi:sodium/proline symporter